MKHIIAFAGSNSKTSINKQLVTYASTLVKGCRVTILDLNDFELPIYGVDVESEKGIPENAHRFLNYIKECDGVLVSLAEHNGAYTSVFKNLFDWISRIESKCFFGKPLLLMATSPGVRGGLGVLEIAKNRFPRHGAAITTVFSLPSFSENFKDKKIIDEKLIKQLETEVSVFSKAVDKIDEKISN